MRKRKMFLLFNHKLTQEQIQDAIESLNVNNFLYLPENLQQIWSNVTPETDFEEIKKFIKENTSNNDYILIQGEFGASYKMINWSKENYLIPIYSFTTRESIEKTIGSEVTKVSVFRHKKYCYYG